MKRIFASLLLLALGVMLAMNVGHVYSLLLTGATRNPLTIAVTTFVSENAPTPIYRFEQDILLYFHLAPYFVVAGFLGTLAFTQRIALDGVLLPIGYALTSCVMCVRLSFRLDGISWTYFLPVMVPDLCHPAFFLIGVGIGNVLRHRRFPQWRLIDAIWATTLFSILCYAVLYRPFLLLPVLFLVSSYLLAWRMLAGTFDARQKAE